MPSKTKPTKKAAKKKTAGKAKSAKSAFTLQPLTTASLVAARSETVQPATITCTFTSGIGQVTATLFRQGVMINMESISTTGVIHFSDVQTGDAISVNGVCAGNADISLDRSTTPANPKPFEKIILAVFLIN